MDILSGIWCAIRPACGPGLALSVDENRPGGTPILLELDRAGIGPHAVRA